MLIWGRVCKYCMGSEENGYLGLIVARRRYTSPQKGRIRSEAFFQGASRLKLQDQKVRQERDVKKKVRHRMLDILWSTGANRGHIETK